jgi:hypothetical protein
LYSESQILKYILLNICRQKRAAVQSERSLPERTAVGHHRPVWLWQEQLAGGAGGPAAAERGRGGAARAAAPPHRAAVRLPRGVDHARGAHGGGRPQTERATGHQEGGRAARPHGAQPHAVRAHAVPRALRRPAQAPLHRPRVGRRAARFASRRTNYRLEIGLFFFNICPLMFHQDKIILRKVQIH